MSAYTPEQLQAILADHSRWLRNEDGGKRANLDGANLVRANLVRANLVRANLDFRIFQLGPIGSRRDYLVATRKPDEPTVITAGCFTGAIGEFLAAVAETHGDNEHAQAYRQAVSLIRHMMGEAAPVEAAA